jgi:hypothetical protein
MGKVNIIRPQEGFQEQFCKTNVDFCIGGGVLAAGKLLPLNERVLTPGGWVKNGELSVGDFVCTPFGKPARILQTFDHKDKGIYLLTTNDGRHIECGLEHLWAIRTKKQLSKYNSHKNKLKNITVCDTSTIIKMIDDGKKVYIPLPDAQEFPEKEYLIPPYAMGVMIGDGCLTSSTWSNYNAIIISNTEDDIVERFSLSVGGDRVYSHNSNSSKYIYTKNAQAYREYCKEIGLNTHSYNKFIPKDYLNGSIAQRLELLHGLMDTDGNVDKKGCQSFSTTSIRLVNDFVELCRSLGYMARVSVDNRSEKYTQGIAYEIIVSTQDCIVSSKKHLKRYAQYLSNNRSYTREYKHAYVKSVEYIRSDDARCILIDDPSHLYVAGDYLTTHNTFGAVLSIAEAVTTDGNFRGLFLRNNLDDTKASGGILDTFDDIYGKYCHIVKSENPRVEFPIGARCDVTHVADQSRSKVLQRFKGRQYDFIYFDELTGFSWECFSAIYTRNRGTAKWTGKVRATTNPERICWVRKFIDWYVGIDGFIREDRNGIVRYFYMAGESVEEVVWGNTKEEVYQQCSLKINKALEKVIGKDWRLKDPNAWRQMIKSFTFYLGKMSENKSMMQANDGYVGSVAVMGGRNSEQLLEGNWNVSPEEDNSAPIPSVDANYVFLNDEQKNGDRWITCDLADTGTDNFLAIAWDGFHIKDMLILGQTTPRMNAEQLQMFARTHNVADNHIIYDAVRGVYINDYIPDAVQYVSYRSPMGMFGRMAMKLKDECYLRLVEAIKRHMISMDEGLATRIYEHQRLKDNITIQQEFLEECSVVRFKDMASGKKSLFSKKEMNQMLGKGRSMDLLDPCAMRMLPVLGYNYGEELVKTAASYVNDDVADEDTVDIFDDTLWGIR